MKILLYLIPKSIQDIELDKKDVHLEWHWILLSYFICIHISRVHALNLITNQINGDLDNLIKIRFVP